MLKWRRLRHACDHETAAIAMGLVGVLALALIICGCESSPSYTRSDETEPTTSELSRGLASKIDAAADDVGRAQTTLESATPENLPQTKPVVGEQLSSAARNLGVAKQEVSGVTRSADVDAQAIAELREENAKLKQADDLRWWLRTTAYRTGHRAYTCRRRSNP